MRTIRVFDIEGIPKSENGHTMTIYTFQEMIHYQGYDPEYREIDQDVQERDNPVGWIIKEETKNGVIFIPVYETEKFEFLKSYEVMNEIMERELPHSGVLN